MGIEKTPSLLFLLKSLSKSSVSDNNPSDLCNIAIYSI